MTDNLIRLLVVDDSETNNILIKSLFEESGKYTVDVLSDSSKAINQILKSPPDILLLDLMMPNIDGLTILKQIRKNDKIKNLPIVIVSALDQDASILEAKENGATDFVTKPIGKNQLFHKVEKLLQNK